MATFKFLFACILLFAPISTIAQSKNYLLYHKTISQIEVDIIGGEYSKALKKYKNLYRHYDKSFAKDDFNAFIASVLAKKHKQSSYFLLKLAKKGVPIDTIINKTNLNKHFVQYFAGNQWKKSKQMYALVYQTFLNNQDAQFLDTLKLLAHRDQYLRQNGGYALYRDSILKVDNENYELLQKIITNRGFPNEEEIGYGGFLRPAYVYIILRHDAQFAKDTSKLGSLLYNEVVKGNFSVNCYAELEDILYLAKTKKTKYSVESGIYICNNKAAFFNHANDISFINKNRELLGLPLIEQQQKQAIFSTHNDLFLFYSEKPVLLLKDIKDASVKKYLEDRFVTHFSIIDSKLLGSAFLLKYQIK